MFNVAVHTNKSDDVYALYAHFLYMKPKIICVNMHDLIFFYGWFLYSMSPKVPRVD